MPVLGAEEAIKPLLELSPQPKVIIVTMFDNARLMRKFTRLGASAYLSKSVSLPDLLAAVHAVAPRPAEEGDKPPPKEVLYRVERRGEAPLSERELEVLLESSPRGEQPPGRAGAPPLGSHGQASPGEHLRQARRRFPRGGYPPGALGRLDLRPRRRPGSLKRTVAPLPGGVIRAALSSERRYPADPSSAGSVLAARTSRISTA